MDTLDNTTRMKTIFSIQKMNRGMLNVISDQRGVNVIANGSLD
jgi:hypothetical protein